MMRRFGSGRTNPVARATAALTLVALGALTACGGESTSSGAAADRRAAAAVAAVADLDPCSLAPAAPDLCTLEVGGAPTPIQNGQTAVLLVDGTPVTRAEITDLCWSPNDGDADDESACISDGLTPPAALQVETTTVARSGRDLAALRVAIGTVVDAAGEGYLPLPLAVSLDVAAGSEVGPVRVEVACCRPVPARPATITTVVPPAAEPPVADEPTDAIVGSGGNRGTRVCVVNQSPKEVVVFWRVFDSADSVEETWLDRGGRSCAEGTSGTGDDVRGFLGRRYRDGVHWDNLQIQATNKWFGYPKLWLVQKKPRGDAGGATAMGARCYDGEGAGFSVNETQSYDSGWLTYTVKRENDTAWKEFVITVTDTTRPSDTQYTDRRCLGGDDFVYWTKE